jgi:glycosyltransferase involved in cell wall biosynthesis
MDLTNTKYSIVMFAHNEEKNIEQSVISAINNTDSNFDQLFVIANGCSDKTIEIMERLLRNSIISRTKLIKIDFGDKCNAWNYYVHSIATSNQVHFFIDADVKFTKGAFAIMFDTLISSNAANAIAGLPFSGRNIDYYRSLVIEKSCLFGNCYGVKFNFIKLIREKEVRLPIGLGWIDSAITKLINSDAGNQHKTYPGRVTHSMQAGYYFKSLNPIKIDDIKLYINRIARYKLGQLQEVYLDQLEFEAWPDNTMEINQRIRNDIISGDLYLPIHLRYLVLKRIAKSIKS